MKDMLELRIPLEGESRYTVWERLDTVEEIRRRAVILQKADKDMEFRAGLWEMCRRDIAFFCDNFCWIYEPRPGMEHIQPWHPYPHELKQLDWMEERFKNREDGLIEKSREMGVSWSFCLWLIWHFLFDSEFSYHEVMTLHSIISIEGNFNAPYFLGDMEMNRFCLGPRVCTSINQTKTV